MPQDKSKEHVVPRWLIELTGKPNRNARFGFTKDVHKKTITERTFAFDKFTFPACSRCNQKYSDLEGKAKKTLCEILDGKEISVPELSEFLDWFDKVRVGLWLGMRLLDKDMARVEPSFHIETRLGQYDRLLFIEKSDFSGNRLNFVGAETLCFALTPSAFMLIVNGYHFTNVSSMFLFSRRLGFPYIANARLHPDRDDTEVEFMAGRERVMTPLIRRAIAEHGTRIFQPMFKGGLMKGEVEAYKSNYVRAHSLDPLNGAGNIFIESGNSLMEYGLADSVCLEPNKTLPDSRQNILSGINILEWQLWLHRDLPSTELLTSDQRRYIKHRFGMADHINNMLIKHYRKML